MYDTILIATDGSDRTRAAVAHGLGLAETYGATVHALFVVDTRALSFDGEGVADDQGIIEILTQQGRRATEEISREARDRGLGTESSVVHGTPARKIRQYADKHDVDVIAMGTRGRSGIARYMLGSVTETVLRKATQPVLTARGAIAERGVEYDRILLPTDGGAQAERAAVHAFDIASRYGATVHALSVIDGSLINSPALLAALEEESERALESVKHHENRRDVDVVTSVWKGTPSDCITTYATENHIDLITMGAHERRGLDRFLTRSVGKQVVRTAGCPVLTLRR